VQTFWRINSRVGDGEPSPPEISDEFVAAVEDEIGMGSGAWDMIHPDAICRAIIKVFQDRRSGAAQEVSPPPTKARLGRTYERPKIEIPCEAGEEVSSHQYISTACLHGQHEKCRRFCKYCKVPCACKNCVHVEEVSPPSPEPRETDGHPVGWCCKHCYDGGYQAAMRLLAEGDTRELKAALAKFVQNGKIRIKQLETMKEFCLCQAGELAVWRVVCDDLEKLLG
jgi:hypothetical protein